MSEARATYSFGGRALKALGGALENHSQPAVPSETAVQVAPSAEAMEPVAAGPSAPRSGSKLARVIELLQRDHGATIDELIDATLGGGAEAGPALEVAGAPSGVMTKRRLSRVVGEALPGSTPGSERHRVAR